MLEFIGVFIVLLGVMGTIGVVLCLLAALHNLYPTTTAIVLFCLLAASLIYVAGSKTQQQETPAAKTETSLTLPKSHQPGQGIG